MNSLNWLYNWYRIKRSLGYVECLPATSMLSLYFTNIRDNKMCANPMLLSLTCPNPISSCSIPPACVYLCFE